AYRWMLVDLQSSNGTFVRIGNTVLKHQSELLVGRSRYRFEAAGAAVADVPLATQAQDTVNWGSSPATALSAALVEITPTGPGQRVALTQAECWIGREKGCNVVRPDDPFVSPRHARLYRDGKGQWHAENNKSLNGLWLRMDQVPIDTACQFQLG